MVKHCFDYCNYLFIRFRVQFLAGAALFLPVRQKCPKTLFPKNSVIGLLWIQAVKNPLLSALPYEEINRKRYFVCRNHFSQDCILFKGQRPLSKDAIPTLYLPERNDKEREQQEKENVIIDAGIVDEEKTLCELALPVYITPSVKFYRSPRGNYIRKSSLRIPNTSPVKVPSCFISKKRLLLH